MSYNRIVTKTYRTFFVATAISTIGLAVMSLLNILFAGLCFGGDGMFVVGLALPVVIFTEIVTYFFGVGGGIAVSIRQGRGERKAAAQIFTLALICTAALGILLAVLGSLFASQIVPTLGAKTAEQQLTGAGYVRVLLLGMPAVLLCGVLNVFIRNDGQPKLAMTGILISIVSDLALLGLFIRVLKMPLYSIALATVLSNALCVLFYLWCFFRGKCTLTVEKSIDRSLFMEIARPGFAGSVIFLAQTVLTVFINRMLLGLSGAAGIAAYGVVKYAITFIYAVYDSIGHAAQPMLSVYHGARDPSSIRLTAKVALRYLAVGTVALCVVLCLGAPFLSNVFHLEVTEALRIIGFSCLFSSSVAFLNGVYRATGRPMLSLLFIVLDNLVLPVLFILFFVSVLHLGEFGIWLALLCSEVVTIALMLLLTRGDPLQIQMTETPKERSYQALILNQETDVVALTEQVEAFCERNGIDAKKQYYILLCIEEIAVNIIQHGFRDGKEHYIDIRILVGTDVLLNIRDDAIQFDPTKKEDADVNAPIEERDLGGLGIYLVKKIAKEFSYRRVIGFNDLHIVL